MEVILTQEVLGLGDPGDLVKVKNGYGRNYLVPQGLAIEATKKNMAVLEAERKRIAAIHGKEAERIAALGDKLKGVSLTIKARAGLEGKLYGSVTKMDIAKALAEQGHEVDRRRVLLEAPIKQVGTFQVGIKFHPQVIPQIEVRVEPEGLQDAAKARAEAAAEAAPASEQAAAPAEAAEEAASSEPSQETGQSAEEEEPKASQAGKEE